MKEDRLYKSCYIIALSKTMINFYVNNKNKKFIYNNKDLTLNAISKKKLEEHLPEDFDKKLLNHTLGDIVVDPLKDNSFLNGLKKYLNMVIKEENLDQKDFMKYLENHNYLSIEKIDNLKSQNLKRKVEKSKMPQNTDEEKLIYKVLNERFSKKKTPILPKVVVPLKTKEEIEKSITEDIEDLKDLSRLEKMIADRFYAYVLVRFGKTKEDLLNDMNEKINHSNSYRKAYNEEIDKDIFNKNTLYQKDYIYDERGMMREKLSILPSLIELPRDYYLKSIYTEEFFNTHEKDRFLANQIEELKKEEKIKEKEEQDLKNRLHTYKLLLKHRLGYSNNEINDMDDKTVFSIVEEAKEHGIFDKEKDENENRRIRRS